MHTKKWFIRWDAEAFDLFSGSSPRELSKAFISSFTKVPKLCAKRLMSIARRMNLLNKFTQRQCESHRRRIFNSFMRLSICEENSLIERTRKEKRFSMRKLGTNQIRSFVCQQFLAFEWIISASESERLLFATLVHKLCDQEHSTT